MLSTSWGKALEPNIKRYVQDAYNEHPDFTPEIFNIDDDSTGIQRYHDAFGPALIPASSEGAESQEVSISNGHSFVAVSKSNLINGEGQAIDNPQQGESQLQRLSDWSRLWERQAIVRTPTII